MKTFTVILFLLAMICNANANIYNAQRVEQGMKNRIILRGHYDEGKLAHAKTRSLPIFPILASIDNRGLYLEFSTSIFDLSIAIIKDGTEVISKTVTVEAGQCETFDLSGYDAGYYQIVLTTLYGTCLYGDVDLM